MGNPSEAIDVLKASGENRVAMALGWGGAHNWVLDRAQLARLYRKSGQEAEARAIESHLLKLLALADADQPLLRELRARH